MLNINNKLKKNVYENNKLKKRDARMSTQSLFCCNEPIGLVDYWGEEFDKLYLKYEQCGKEKKVVQARKHWFAIFQSQIETCNPQMSCNGRRNQQKYNIYGYFRDFSAITTLIIFTKNGRS